jgi:hypothetical protein
MTKCSRGVPGFTIPGDPMLKEAFAVTAHWSDRLRARPESPFQQSVDASPSLPDRNPDSIRNGYIEELNPGAFPQRACVQEHREISLPGRSKSRRMTRARLRSKHGWMAFFADLRTRERHRGCEGKQKREHRIK